LRVEFDLGLRHLDRRQGEVLTGDEIELVVDVVDLLAQLAELGRRFVAKPSKVLGIDLPTECLLRSGAPLCLSFSDPPTQCRVDVWLKACLRYRCRTGRLVGVVSASISV